MYAAAASNSVFCSWLRRLSFDALTCASAARTLLRVWKPSKRFCWMLTPNEPVVSLVVPDVLVELLVL